MKNNNNNINIVPVISYSNAKTYKNIIIEENIRKSGIYRWRNLITNKSYIGSSVSLNGRFSTYYSLIYLEKKVKKGSSAIYSALLKYGYSNFSLDILEYIAPDKINQLILREQYYMNVLKPEYNILKIAGSRLGSKQSKKSKELIGIALRNRVFSKDSIAKMQLAAKSRKGEKTSFHGRTHTIETITRMSATKCILVKVIDLETNIVKIFKGNL